MSEVWWVFSTQTPFNYVVEAYAERANTTPGPGHRSAAMGGRDWPDCSLKDICSQGELVGESVILCVFYSTVACGT